MVDGGIDDLGRAAGADMFGQLVQRIGGGIDGQRYLTKVPVRRIRR